jgi:branched-subunit amino acid aminotransferase/4-amino-4-deoxychorismate lyase
MKAKKSGKLLRNDSASPAPVKSWLWTGQRFQPTKSVPLTDRGFRYGMSVFESLRVTNGDPEFWERHLSRLITACAERDLSVDERVLAAAGEKLRRSGVDGFARIYITAGDGAPTAPAKHPRVFVFIEKREPPNADDVWEITLSDETYHPIFGGLKTANYWFNAEVLTQTRQRGFDEALLFNDFAELVSACCANVFLVRNDRVLTPPRSSGARAGAIREWVIARRKVEERRLRREDVINADEIFLTNSWIGVMPVATVEGRPLGHRYIGPRLAAELESRRHGR